MNEIRKKWFKELEDVKNAPPNFLDEIQKRLSEYDNITVAEVRTILALNLFIHINGDIFLNMDFFILDNWTSTSS